jgi:hypothetical protein
MDFLAANPVWLMQDMVVLVLSIATGFFIIKHEPRPAAILMEMLAFVFFYALVYENFATLAGYYHYGRSLLMVGNVPVSIGFLEWLVVYASLRMLAAAKIPVWLRPFIVGLCGVLQDATIDPVAVRQVAGGIGRWSWREGPDWAVYLAVPVFNFAGWFFLTGFAAAMILLGRAAHRKLGYGVVAGYVYPVVAMIAALVLLTSPLMYPFLWLAPKAEFGSPHEWYALAIWLSAGAAALAVWRWRMRRALSLRADWPVLAIPAILHLADIVGALAGGFHDVLVNEFAVTAVHLGIVGAAFGLRRARALPLHPAGG